jgi:hypothetical protein
MDAETAVVVKDVETNFAEAADVVVEDELIDDLLELGKGPAAAANFFDLIG